MVLNKFSFTNKKPKTKSKPYVPEQPNQYQGRQVIINSDRILFNAKEDSVLIYADKSINLNTQGTINFDTTSAGKFIVNAPLIQLGMVEKNYDGKKTQPHNSAVLGDELELWLDDLLDLMENILYFIIGPEFSVTCPVPDPNVNSASTPGDNDIQYLEDEIGRLRKHVQDFKSKRVKLT